MEEHGDNIVVIRPGALGDVVVAHALLGLLREVFPAAHITLLAPGERGRLLAQFGCADAVFDFADAECGWLFSDGRAAPGERLAQAFSGARAVVAFTGAAGSEDALPRRIADIAPQARTAFFPARPADAASTPIGLWLAEQAIGFCRQQGLLSRVPSQSCNCGQSAVIAALSKAGNRRQCRAISKKAQRSTGRRERCSARNYKIDWVLGALPDFAPHLSRRYAVMTPAGDASTLVMHPGSGGARKNWPVENFAALARELLRLRSSDGTAVFNRLVVTSGEADKDLGTRLCRLVPGAEPALPCGLAGLAGILAGAGGYVGNDSGVSHLAACVKTPEGRHPRLAVVFGPTNARVWAPPGALILHAGPGMDCLPPAAAARAIAAFFLA